MINYLREIIQEFNGALSRHEQSRVNAENEYLAMSCGSFNPRFLAKIKRCKADEHRDHAQGTEHLNS
jgi:hypothetical protein